MTDQCQFKSKQLQQLFEDDLQALHETVQLILSTGFGKSRAIIAPLADVVRWATGTKSVVVVPTKILRAIHHEYCIDAKFAPELLIDPDCVETIYCTYGIYLENQHLIPKNANIFIDESHLFLKEKARIVDKKIILPSETLKRFARVYMLSATLGGQQGIAELQKLFKGSSFIHSPKELSQKDLSQVQVIGNLADRDSVLEKAVEIAKLKAQIIPVILFCKSDEECLKLKSLLQDASVFEENSDIAQLLDIIRVCKEISKDKIILTTQKACIGIDFIFKVLRAFVILTEDAEYLEELLQPLGRSSRIDEKLFLLGCILTQGDCSDISSLEKSLKDKSADLKVFGKQFRDNIGILVACPAAKNQNQLLKIEAAVDSFNFTPNQSVKNKLQSIPDFKRGMEEYFKQTKKTESTSALGQNIIPMVSIAQILNQSSQNYGVLKQNLSQRDDSDYSNYSSSNESQFIKRQKIQQSQKEDAQMHEVSDFQDQSSILLNEPKEDQFNKKAQMEEGKNAEECLNLHRQMFKEQEDALKMCSLCNLSNISKLCSVCQFVFCNSCFKVNNVTQQVEFQMDNRNQREYQEFITKQFTANQKQQMLEQHIGELNITLGKRIQRNQENDSAQQTLQMKRLKLNEKQTPSNVEMKEDYQETSAFQEEHVTPEVNASRERQLFMFPQIEQSINAKECLEEHQKFHRQNSQKGECSLCSTRSAKDIHACSVCSFKFCGKCFKDVQSLSQEEKVLLKKLAEKHNIALVPMFQAQQEDEQRSAALSFQVSDKPHSVQFKKQKYIIGEYKCEKCDKYFKTAGQRASHKYKVHSQSGKEKQKQAKEKNKKV